jgi:hypothetical protein
MKVSIVDANSRADIYMIFDNYLATTKDNGARDSDVIPYPDFCARPVCCENRSMGDPG